jgi:hypothetical protein
MKPALVLGLAIAANAMVADSNDNNELFVAPTGSHAQKYQGKYIMYDEVADDELGIKYVHLPHPIPDVVAYDDDELLIRPVVPHIAADDAADDELAQRYVHPPYYVPGGVAYDDDELVYARPLPVNFDEVADDELGVKIVHLPVAETMAYDDDELAVKYVHLPHPIPDVVAYDDDEFLAKKPREESKMTEAYKQAMGWKRGQQTKEADDELVYAHPVLVKYDEAADDELAITTGQYQRYPIHRSPIYSKYDEVADDELAITQQIAHFPEFVAYDDDELAYVPPVLADDELAITPEQYHRVQNLGSIHARFDEVADDELRVRPISVLPPAPEHVAFDDELSLMPIPPKFVNREWIKPIKMPASEALLRDDEADDELLYLGQLIKDGGYIPRPYFDDEFRAEKPSHMKAQERTHMKTELPKSKLRPVVNQPAMKRPDTDGRPTYQDYII